jgi:hypothetical protein
VEWAVQGPPDEGFLSPDAGLIPRIIAALFDGVRRLDPNVEVSIKVMYVCVWSVKGGEVCV